MPIYEGDEERMIAALREVEGDVDEEILRQAREPERCRHCGCLLSPTVASGRFIYTCMNCED